MKKPVHKLIETDELVKAAKLDRFGGYGTARVLMGLLRINKLNKLYDAAFDKEGVEFIDELISKLDLDYEVREEELKRIPASGPFIVVANHPYGGIDGMLLAKVISSIRPDIKIMANFLLQRIKPISEFFLPVIPLKI